MFPLLATFQSNSPERNEYPDPTKTLPLALLFTSFGSLSPTSSTRSDTLSSSIGTPSCFALTVNLSRQNCQNDSRGTHSTLSISRYLPPPSTSTNTEIQHNYRHIVRSFLFLFSPFYFHSKKSHNAHFLATKRVENNQIPLHQLLHDCATSPHYTPSKSGSTQARSSKPLELTGFHLQKAAVRICKINITWPLVRYAAGAIPSRNYPDVRALTHSLTHYIFPFVPFPQV